MVNGSGDEAIDCRRRMPYSRPHADAPAPTMTRSYDGPCSSEAVVISKMTRSYDGPCSLEENEDEE